MIILAVLASSAAAHHILGLPHYSYKENYPQAPTLEYPAFTGPYDILLTSYPGKPVPQEPGDDGGMLPPPDVEPDAELLANTENCFSNDFPPQFGQTTFSLFLCSISKLLSHFAHLYSYNGILLFS